LLILGWLVLTSTTERVTICTSEVYRSWSVGVDSNRSLNDFRK